MEEEKEKEIIKGKLKARIYSIKANIKFAKNYLNRQISDNEEKEVEIKELKKQQEEYKDDVERLLERFEKNIEKNTSDKKVNERKLIEDADFYLNKKSDTLNAVFKKLHEWKNKSELLIDVDIKIDQAFDDCSKISEKSPTDQNEIIVILIGQRGAGKSTFVNLFMECNNFDKNACKTDVVESTLDPELYDYYDQNKLENFGNQKMSLKL
jgi:ATPase subunit of ABC transporter with duplicated ATPase domains